jgi:membrane dipeptidase
MGADLDRLYGSAVVWDMTLPWVTGYIHPEILPRFRKAGITLTSLTIASDPHLGPDFAVRNMAAVRRYAAAHADSFVVIDTVDDVLEAKADGKLALTFNLQGTNPVAGDIALVDTFFRLGVRHMLLAYNKRNFVADGCAERTDSGLSRVGVSLVQEMNRVGMLVDGTHSGYRSTMEAIDISTKPFIFSHCNAHAVYPHYRNIRDDQIKACAATGGVIGVNGLGAFLDEGGEATSAAMFRHLNHMVSLVGPEHVGLGLDYVRDTDMFWNHVESDPNTWPPPFDKPHVRSRFGQPEQVRELTAIMAGHGYADDQILDILGRNFMRVCRAVRG